jgi:hypothetical protein
LVSAAAYFMGEDVSDSIKTMIYGTIDSLRSRNAIRTRRRELGPHRAVAGICKSPFSLCAR